MVIPSKLKFFEEENLKASAYVSKQKGSTSETDAKDRRDKIVEEEGVTESMLSSLNSTSSLVGKNFGQNSCNKLLCVKLKKNH